MTVRLVPGALLLVLLAGVTGCESMRGPARGFEEVRARAEGGNAQAEYQVGQAYISGVGVNGDAAAAVGWFRKSAEQGYAPAQNALGICYHRGQGVSYDAAESVKWLRKAAEQGDAEAQAGLGLAFLQGRGVEGSFDEAEKWFTKSADQGNEAGEGLLLGLACFEAVAEGGDASEAWQDLQAAAEDGNAVAQASVGLAYFYGQGVPRSDREALKWFRRAAAQQNAVGQAQVGLAYLQGRGVRQNFRQAVYWSRAAAEQGNELAQQTLGLCYRGGHGVAQDQIEAVKWFRKSAEQGYPDALVCLGRAYRRGEGVAQDNVQAYVWLDRAAAQGNPEAAAARGELARVMTPEQLSRAGVMPRRHLTKFDRQIIDAHQQRYNLSCIPSAVEMALKLMGRVPGSYYEQQEAWRNKADGSFHDFDGKTIAGVTFRSIFWQPHGPDFPLAELFQAIDRELKAGRFVIVGLACPGGTHDWVIYDEDARGEFLAISKNGSNTIEDNHARQTITRMQGTDIGTYEVKPLSLGSRY